MSTEFADCTVITIAHRLGTIMEYDNILVLNEGEVAEFGTPQSLLELKDGLFSSLTRELSASNLT